MTRKEFGQLLKETVLKYDISVNNAIRKTNINRSSYFKFLSGERVPTYAQIHEIISSLSMSEKDGKILIKSFEKVRYSAIAWINHEIVRECLKSVTEWELSHHYQTFVSSAIQVHTNSFLSEKTKEISSLKNIQGKAAVSDALILFIQLSSEALKDTDIYAFLPLDATTSLLRCHIDINNEKQSLHFLFHFSDSTDDADRHDAPKFHDLIPLSLSLRASVHFFYGPSDLTEGLGLLYPYYVISDLGILYLNARLDSAYISTDRDQIQANRAAYQKVLPMTYDILQRNHSLHTLQEKMLAAINASEKIYMIDPSPCIALIATKELAQVMVPTENRKELWAYCSALQQAAPLEIVSAEGIQKMVAEKSLSECGLAFHASETVVHSVLLRLKDRLGKTLFIADSNHITVPEDWGTLVVPDREVTLFPYEDSFDTVSFKEKSVLSAFSASFERSLDYFVLRPNLAERILDYYLQKTEK